MRAHRLTFIQKTSVKVTHLGTHRDGTSFTILEKEHASRQDYRQRERKIGCTEKPLDSLSSPKGKIATNKLNTIFY